MSSARSRLLVAATLTATLVTVAPPYRPAPGPQRPPVAVIVVGILLVG